VGNRVRIGFVTFQSQLPHQPQLRSSGQISTTFQELKLKYDIAVEEHTFDGASTGRVTVVLTLANEGRLKPLDGVDVDFRREIL
jgi:hypothetical protein